MIVSKDKENFDLRYVTVKLSSGVNNVKKTSYFTQLKYVT